MYFVDFNRQPEWLRGGGDGFRFFPRRQRRPPDVVRFERERRARLAAAKRLAAKGVGWRRRKATGNGRRRGS